MALSDLLISSVLLAITLLTAAAYCVRIFIKGRAHYDRVDRQGGSPLLGKGLMEMGYWALQPLARAAIRLGISANAISFAALVFGAATGASLAYGHFGSGGVFGMLGGIFDALDGMVARATGTMSGAGKILDSALDRYVEFFFFGGLLIHYSGSLASQGLVFLAMLGSFMVSYSTALSEISQIHLPRGSMQRPERMVYLISAAVLSPISLAIFRTGEGAPYPILFSLVLIAWVANLSAWARIRYVRRAIEERERKVIERTLAPVRNLPRANRDSAAG